MGGGKARHAGARVGQGKVGAAEKWHQSREQVQLEETAGAVRQGGRGGVWHQSREQVQLEETTGGGWWTRV